MKKRKPSKSQFPKSKPRREADLGMRFHIFGMAHLPTLKEISPCAYTQKIVNLCKMLKREKNTTVYFYGVEGSKVDCDENITVVPHKTWKDQFGNNNWHIKEFDTGDGKGPCWDAMRTNAAREVEKRLNNRDFVLCPQGWWHKPIIDKIKRPVCISTVESGIGYRGIFARFKVFESYAWMHFLLGQKNINDGHNYDTVIPNYYDQNDFPAKSVERKSDYVLFIGRLVWRKGVEVAIKAAQAAGRKILVAGQVTGETKPHWVKGPNLEYLGVLGHKDRAEIMSKARAVLVPTLYVEPFGGVAVESALCGAPVIASDWGAFTETVLQGVTGYRCAAPLGEWVWAIENANAISPIDCRHWAMSNFELGVIGPRYMHYFQRILDMYTKDGWFSQRRAPLDSRKVCLP